MAQPSSSAHFSGDNNSGVQAGSIHGSVTINNHEGQRPETPPEPSCKIPFKRDDEFINRPAIFDKIKEKLEAPGSRVALVGMGGVGKSQIAIQYAYCLENQLSDTWIFWIYASNSARFQESLEEIAHRGKIPGRDDPKRNTLGLVRNWLLDDKRKWVVILDNADDLDFLKDTSTEEGTNNKRLDKYLPKTQNGSIFVTSRSREAALQLVDRRNIINVHPMDETQAVSLFRKKLNEGYDDKVIAELAAELGYLPLAIVQAASYISLREPRCSVQEYLEDFRGRNLTKKLKLLSDDNGDHRRDEEAVNSVSATFKISFNRIRKTRPSAADLLAIMCFFNRQGIPDYVLQPEGIECETTPRKKEDSSTPGLPARDESFENDIRTLISYCFISTGANPKVFDMHRLVQLAAQEWLDDNESFVSWQVILVTRLLRRFLDIKYENWGRCQQLYPHMKSAIGHKPQGGVPLQWWGRLLYRAALYVVKRGNMVGAVAMSTIALEVSKEAFGEDDPITLYCNDAVQFMQPDMTPVTGNNEGSSNEGAWRWWTRLYVWLQWLTWLYIWPTGRLEKAEKRQLKVIKAVKKVNGPKHPATVRYISNLVSIYRLQGQLDEAEQLQEAAVESSKKANGPEHPATLYYMSGLVLLYQLQDRLGQANQLQGAVVESSKRVNSPKHEATLYYTSGLASIYQLQGQLDQAKQLKQLLEAVVESSKRGGGVDIDIYARLLDKIELPYLEEQKAGSACEGSL
ncbi:hypothetical protein McanMca71_000042 [Microsporum canis]|uniref:Uncharacterized protein n=1 Tax=Arthroderma otae (strain ATCC MYA-4605 / CBS 113480) TaxID=554155 RepID=C5FCJ4_ARTOC|nr:conserved hypothetical protein [Microsporum canis CBS 113480]EEQ27528.1 conserved hypothetical protein [Microsporum canis CBS 113480]